MASAFAKATADKPAAFSALYRAHVLAYAPRAKAPAALLSGPPRLREDMLFEHPQLFDMDTYYDFFTLRCPYSTRLLGTLDNYWHPAHDFSFPTSVR